MFTFVLVGAVLLVGELNTIAPVLTVFFLINPLACIIGFAFVFAIYIILKRIEIRRSWGDFRRGIWNHLIQFSLMNLERSREDAVAWRPSLLLMSRDLVSRQKLIQIAFGLTRRSGLLTCINLFRKGEYDAAQLEADAREFREMLHAKRITAFYRSAVVDHYLSGQLIASQVHGIGEFRHNTILLDWAESIRGNSNRSGGEAGDQFKLIRFYRDLKLSLLLLNVNPEIQRSGYQNIDLWWDPGQRNGSFMLLLAHLLTTSRYWSETKLTIKTIVLRANLEQTRGLLQELVDRSRIRAAIEVLSPDTVQEAVFGLEFERFRKRQQRRKRLFDVVRGVLSFPDVKEQEVPEEEELKLRKRIR